MKSASSLLAAAALVLVVVFAVVMDRVIPSLTEDTRITTSQSGVTEIQQPIGSTLKIGVAEDDEAATTSAPATASAPGNTASTAKPGDTTSKPGNSTASASGSGAQILAGVVGPVPATNNADKKDKPKPTARQGATITEPLESKTSTDALIAILAGFLILGAGLLVALLRALQPPTADPSPPTVTVTVTDDVNGAIDAAAAAQDGAARVVDDDETTRPYMRKVVLKAGEAAAHAHAVADWMTTVKCPEADVAKVRTAADEAQRVKMPDGLPNRDKAKKYAKRAVDAAEAAAEAVIAGPPAAAAKGA